MHVDTETLTSRSGTGQYRVETQQDTALSRDDDQDYAIVVRTRFPHGTERQGDDEAKEKTFVKVMGKTLRNVLGNLFRHSTAFTWGPKNEVG